MIHENADDDDDDDDYYSNLALEEKAGLAKLVNSSTDFGRSTTEKFEKNGENRDILPFSGGIEDENCDMKIKLRKKGIRCRPSVYVFYASLMAALGGVLFGYDLGIISGASLQLAEEFHLSCKEIEVIVSALSVGTMAVIFFAGFLVDYCGRRASIIINDIIYLVGTIVLSSAQSYAVLVLGRLIIGCAIALSCIADCTYITEISPPARRGFLVSLHEVGITVGFFLAYLFNYIFISIHNGWRYMFGMAAILPIFQAVGMCFLPKSPRYLVVKGMDYEAKLVLYSVLGDEMADEELEKIRVSVMEEKHMKMKDFCCGPNNVWPSLIVALAIVIFLQTSGNPALMSYAPMMFKQFGLESNAASVLATLGAAVVKMSMAVVYLLTVDRTGRRLPLLIGNVVMICALVVLAVVSKVIATDNHIERSCDLLAANVIVTTSHTNAAFDAKWSPLTNVATNANDTVFIETSSDLTTGTTLVATIAMLLYCGGFSIGYGPGKCQVLRHSKMDFDCMYD